MHMLVGHNGLVSVCIAYTVFTISYSLLYGTLLIYNQLYLLYNNNSTQI